MSGEGAPTSKPIDCHDIRVAILAATWHETGDGRPARRCPAGDGRLPGRGPGRGAGAGLVRAARRRQGARRHRLRGGRRARRGDPWWHAALRVRVLGGHRRPDPGRRSTPASAIGFGLLTCDTEEQALDRAGLEGSHEDKGYEASAGCAAHRERCSSSIHRGDPAGRGVHGQHPASPGEHCDVRSSPQPEPDAECAASVPKSRMAPKSPNPAQGRPPPPMQRTRLRALVALTVTSFGLAGRLTRRRRRRGRAAPRPSRTATRTSSPGTCWPSTTSTATSTRRPGSSGTVNGVPAGGVEYLATYVKNLRAQAEEESPYVYTVGAGDLVGASPLVSAAFHDEPVVEEMNSLGLDITSVGNHEFDEGVAELKRLQERRLPPRRRLPGR